MRPKFHVSLKILDEIHLPESVTRDIGITPSRTWYKGDTRPKTLLIEKKNGWELKSALSEESSLSEHVNYLLSIMEPARKQLKEVTRKCYSLLACVIYVDEEMPEIHFDFDVIQRLADLNPRLDIDVYCLADCNTH